MANWLLGDKMESRMLVSVVIVQSRISRVAAGKWMS